MKKLSFIPAALCLIFASCSNDRAEDNNAKETDLQQLEKMYQEIVTLSKVNSETCTDSKDWDFTAIGSKACGGPEKFIIYSKKINTAAFLAKVKTYTDARAAFNVKWNIFSTCDVALPPAGVGCADRKPVLLWNVAF
ncbi:hypothetical protein [Flavobacterium sp. LC2016-01]|uniref:hypothetical protein n=1 Tax=Flavobacterium sp. LC2016-01 TaxID=2675876 RepID=UPI0012BAB996|nr:hypothetical protein [Flavobacterium sp. LC2016-01]MTH14372.1 hypothetical protein [Flavobacterium sp. LC2016-01]